MSEIIDVFAREILDSRGFPTIEAEVWLADEVMAAQRFPLAPPPVFMKLLNCAMVKLPAIWAKAF